MHGEIGNVYKILVWKREGKHNFRDLGLRKRTIVK